MNTAPIDELGHKLGQAALTALARICPEVRSASNEQLELACAVMRAKSKQVVEDLLADAQGAPWIADSSRLDPGTGRRTGLARQQLTW